MPHDLNDKGSIKLRLGDGEVTLFYRCPDPGEVIDAMVRKIPRGDGAKDGREVLMSNLDLGKACVTGIGEGGLAIDGRPLVSDPDRPGFRDDWREVLAEKAPLLLVALGQWLSAPPAFVEESSLKKSSGMPGPSLPDGSRSALHAGSG